MIDLNLRFASQAEWLALDVAQDEDVTVDVIGEIRFMTDDVETILDGWHVNVRVMDNRDVSTLLPHSVTPSEPYRVWLGE